MSNGTEFAGKFRAGARASPVDFFYPFSLLRHARKKREHARQVFRFPQGADLEKVSSTHECGVQEGEQHVAPKLARIH